MTCSDGRSVENFTWSTTELHSAFDRGVTHYCASSLKKCGKSTGSDAQFTICSNVLANLANCAISANCRYSPSFNYALLQPAFLEFRAEGTTRRDHVLEKDLLNMQQRYYTCHTKKEIMSRWDDLIG